MPFIPIDKHYTKYYNYSGVFDMKISSCLKRYKISKNSSKTFNYQRKGSKQIKSTGVVRRVDELGRIVLPIEIRKTLDIKEKDAI